jgi:hypothetical protein
VKEKTIPNTGLISEIKLMNLGGKEEERLEKQQ